ncbi:unnamed protein product [Bursaphelenchus xylophilus]|uniref:(pine wood nematode) hypothetical protein n=1 Tax=Bursaphelenchus xylophilus TaxID=6326 RepID=A0A1I7SS99_BURXY|nr:unnamed protein product [Bursaphelenchus xylophilus]CAG9097850.1 unnamed protein product [Bursaphelenchus xylophilus]
MAVSQSVRFHQVMVSFLAKNIILTLTLISATGSGVEFNLGIIHGIEGSMVWHNVRYAVDEWNKNNLASPIPITLNVIYPTDSFASVEDRFCDVVQHNLIGLIVPAVLLTSEEMTFIFSMCNRINLPCLTTSDLLLNDSNINNFVHSVAPSSGTVGKAAAKLISSLSWNSFVLVYEKPENLIEVTALLSIYYNEHGTRTSIRVLQLPLSLDNYDAFLKYTREQLKQTSIVVHSQNIGIVHELLIKASRLNMTEYRYSYLFTHPDLALLEDFLSTDTQNYRCNVSGMRIVQKSPLIKTDLALSLDSVYLFGQALKDLARRPLLPMPTAILCDADDLWADGEILNEAIKKTSVSGKTTGPVKLSPSGITRDNATFIGLTRTAGRFREVSLAKK